MHRSSFVARGLTLAMCLTLSGQALAKTKVACTGEQTTHSLHRENDPEYPFLMAKQLDADFVATDKMAPLGGGFLEGGGTSFTVGNFAHPQASVLKHSKENPKTYLESAEFLLLVAFKPDLVVLGPFGWHDVLSGVPLANFPSDMDALIAAVQAIDSKPRIALATPVPQGGVDKADGFTQIDGYTRAAATAHQLPIIDVWQDLTGKASLFQDDFHLTVEGRTRLATFVGEAVKALAAAAPVGGAGGMGGGGASGSGGSGGEKALAGSSSGGALAGAGGAASSGSAPVTGTASAGMSAASGGATSPTLAADTPTSSSGCGCRTTASTTAPSASLLGALLMSLVLRRRARAA